MATETITPSASQNDLLPNLTQVKLQLMTRHADISLPEKTGPILVNTSKLKKNLKLEAALTLY